MKNENNNEHITTLRDGMLELRRQLTPIIDRLAENNLTPNERNCLKEHKKKLSEKIKQLRTDLEKVQLKKHRKNPT